MNDKQENKVIKICLIGGIKVMLTFKKYCFTCFRDAGMNELGRGN